MFAGFRVAMDDAACRGPRQRPSAIWPAMATAPRGREMGASLQDPLGERLAGDELHAR